MCRRPPRSTLTATLLPYTPLFRSLAFEEDEHTVRTEIAKIDVRRAVRPVRDIFVGVGGELRKPVEHRFHRRRALIAELLVAHDGHGAVAVEIGPPDAGPGNDDRFALAARRCRGAARYILCDDRRGEKDRSHRAGADAPQIEGESVLHCNLPKSSMRPFAHW